MELKVVENPDEILKKVCATTVPEEVTSELVESMFSLMTSKNGVGLAAPQVGISKRFFVYSKDKSRKNFKVVINPTILKHGKDVEYMNEGCLSVPNHQKLLDRWRVIDVEYTTTDNKVIKETLKGWEARIFQHETDHLDGILCMFKNEPEPIKEIINPNLQK